MDTEPATPPGWTALLLRSPATLGIAGFTLLMFVLEMQAGGSMDFAAHSRWGALRPERVWVDHELYRLVLPTFLHHGPIHLLFNGVAFIQLGILTEHLYGHWRLLWWYLIFGLCGAGASLLFLPSGVGGSLGASGAIMGLAGLLLGSSWWAAEPWRGRLRGLFGRRLLLGVLATFALGIGLNLLPLLIASWGLAGGLLALMLPAIDNWAHAGGFAAGLLCSALYRRLTPDLSLSSAAAAGVAVVVVGASLAWASADGERSLDSLPHDLAQMYLQRVGDQPDGIRAAIFLARAAEAYEDAGELESYSADFEAALQRMEQVDTISLTVGVLWEQHCCEPLLALALQRWGQLAPDDPVALNARAWFLATRSDLAHDTDTAYALSLRSLELADPEDHAQRSTFLDTLAEILLQRGELDQALSTQQEAVSLAEEVSLSQLPDLRARLARIEKAQ